MDKELLELAAKAAGIEFTWQIRNDEFVYNWNPLTDDGDALRLAVKLKIDLQFLKTKILAWYGEIDELEEILNDDPYSATRLAIVRAAAEIGKTL